MSTLVPVDIHTERRETKESKRRKRSGKFTVKKIRSCTIYHDSMFKVTWDWFVLALVLYTAIEIPFSTAFLTKQSKSIWERLSSKEAREIVNVIVDVMFIIDIVINFRTTFVESKSEAVISEPKKIAIHYLKTWFVVDFVAAIPFDFFTGGGEGAASLAGLLKTARLLRVIRVSRKMNRYSEFGLAVIFLLTSIFTLIAHWLACIWNVIGEKEIEVPYGWVPQLGDAIGQPVNHSEPGSGPGVSTRYITALYFTITSLTSIGFGNVAPNTDTEKIFSVLMMLGGALFYAVIFGNLAAIIQRLYSRTARYHRDVRVVNECIALHNIPETLQTTLRDYFTNEQAATRGDDIESIMYRFPESLQAEIRVYLNHDLFEHFDLFDGLSEGCRRALAAVSRPEVFPHQLHLLKEGDQVTKLYFIVSGSVDVLQGEQSTMYLGPGDVAGCNMASRKRRLDHCVKSHVSLLAKVRTLVHLITLKDLMEVMSVYPEIKERITEQMELSCDLAGEMEDNMASMENKTQDHIELLDSDNHHGHMITTPRTRMSGTWRERPNQIGENHTSSEHEFNGELFTTDKQRMERLEAKLSRVEEVLEAVLISLEKKNLWSGKAQSANNVFTHRTSRV